MDISYLGHSCFLLEINSIKLLIDPFIRNNPLAKAIDIEQLKPDHILLTHAHFDHMEDAEEIAKRSGCSIIANSEIIQKYRMMNVDGRELNLGGMLTLSHIQIKMVAALHSSSFPDGSYGGLACGYLIKAPHSIIYIAGDTTCHKDMELLPRFFGPIDVAILPLGDTYTMGVEDAIAASRMIHPKTIIGCHFDTFDAIKLNKEEATQQFSQAEFQLKLLEIGEKHRI